MLLSAANLEQAASIRNNRKIIHIPNNFSVLGQSEISVSLHYYILGLTMYERKIPVDLSCPLRLTMSLIDSKWKSCILDELRHSPMRPSELHKALPEATPRVLDMHLKELVEDGLVNKTVYQELPLRSEYYITELGRTLLPILDAMIEWGEKNRELFDKKYGKTE